MDPSHRIAITICGDGGCGKSSITLRLVRSQWTHDYDPTIEDSYSVTRVIDGTTYSLALTDTAGQEEYRGLWSSSNLASDAFLLVYDITAKSSLEGLEWFEEVIEVERLTRREQGRPLPVVIVAGNKVDLAGRRAVEAREGLEWARRRGYGFMETSAREMVNVEETFALLVRRTVAARANPGASSHSSHQSPLPPQNPTQPLEPVQNGHHHKQQQSQPSEAAVQEAEKAMAPVTNATAGEAEARAKRERGPGYAEEKRGFWRRVRCW